MNVNILPKQILGVAFLLLSIILTIGTVTTAFKTLAAMYKTNSAQTAGSLFAVLILVMIIYALTKNGLDMIQNKAPKPRIVTLPHFGKLDLIDPESCYDAEMEFNGKEIQLDLNVEKKTIAIKKMYAVKNILDNLGAFDKQNKQYIKSDFEDENGDTVKFYLEHHLEVAGEEELAAFIDLNDNSIEPIRQLFDKIHLKHVSFYPENEGGFAIFDYSLGEDFTNYLIVVITDKDGKLMEMTMES